MGMHNTYPSSVSEQQVSLIDDLFPRRSSMGRPLVHERRTILNAIFYVIRSGCPWRYLPHDFPPWQTVYGYFRRWKRAGLWDVIHDVLVKAVREAHGKHPNPTAAILDSQSVKTADQAGARGYDAGKKIKGRKRHRLVDTLGLILQVVVTPAPRFKIATEHGRCWRCWRIGSVGCAWCGRMAGMLVRRWSGCGSCGHNGKFGWRS